ncbi:unnamed protein product [Arabis nemorensis]|uniref:Uncharacterized protein n=1 Tax=Arabis nemorensis TaxID=586526 RepID=A0A565C1K6_9BRAS|nr:unnamed protein product [Arabis nemorensis]
MMKKQVIFVVVLFALFLIFLDAKQVGAIRVLRATVDSEIRFVSLQRGTVPASGGNGCTHIRNGSGECRG